jgi:hypothetical protein
MTGKPIITNPHGAWDEIKNNWVIRVVNTSVIVCFILSIIFLLWKWSRLPQSVPLWYSRPWGPDQLALKILLVLLPLGGVFIYGINRTISIYITIEYLIFSQMLFLSSLLVNLLSLVTLVKILFLVT